jgi:site-specific recombinase XerD
MTDLVQAPGLPEALPSGPLPLEALQAERPRNAGAGTLTEATTDIEAVGGWLRRYLDTPHTLASYRRESNRLLMWLADRRTGLRDMTAEAITDYQAFLRDPQPRERWCLQQTPRWCEDGAQNPAWQPVKKLAQLLADGTPNPAWRPFAAGLSESATNQAITVLFGLGEYLAGVGYLAANPFRAARRRRHVKHEGIERYFDHGVWQAILASIEALPRDTKRDEASYQRIRFIVRFLYLTGLRREEFTQATAKHLKLIRGGWWLKVVGKGKKAAEVPLNTSAIETLREYRMSLGLTAWPVAGEDTPLLLSITGRTGIGVKALHQVLTDFFQGCADPLVRSASAHWLRHTAASHQLDKGVPLQIVQKHLRHANIATTSGYIHADKDLHIAEIEKHKV